VPSALAAAIREVLIKYTRLPDAIIGAQCRSLGKTPEMIVASDIPVLAEKIAGALALFTNPAKGAMAKQEILRLG
jgi:hypothetical protein